MFSSLAHNRHRDQTQGPQHFSYARTFQWAFGRMATSCSRIFPCIYFFLRSLPFVKFTKAQSCSIEVVPTNIHTTRCLTLPRRPRCFSSNDCFYCTKSVCVIPTIGTTIVKSRAVMVVCGPCPYRYFPGHRAAVGVGAFLAEMRNNTT